MMYDAVNNIRNFLFTQMRWCISQQTADFTLWICLIVTMYLIIILLLNLGSTCLENIMEKDPLIQICKAIEEYDIVTCVRLLELYPQLVNKYTRDGYTPFLIACAHGNTQVIKLMLRKGANVTLKSTKKESAFYLATFFYIKYPRFKNATCIRELYYAGANINEMTERGLTPLQMAAMFGHTALVKWLLVKDATTNVIPDPYLIARSQGYHDTAMIILKFSTSLALKY